MTYYLAHKGAEEEFLGLPYPAAGVRVVFDIDRLFAARDRRMGSRVDREVSGDEGLLVYEDPLAMLKLPDRLWRVDSLEGEARLHPRNPWLRCTSLTVREELPNWLVMGPHGASVAQVINQARGLTEGHARAIARLDAAEEERLAGVVWDPRRDPAAYGYPVPPVGCGLGEVRDAVEEAARRTGLVLFGWDEGDGVEFLADPAWQQAVRAAEAAALAVGAPGVLAFWENQRLALRWTSVVGAPQPGV
jgi:hypothetical protein